MDGFLLVEASILEYFPACCLMHSPLVGMAQHGTFDPSLSSRLRLEVHCRY